MQVENKRVKVALLVSEKIDFKLKTIIDKEGYYIIIKGLIHQVSESCSVVSNSLRSHGLYSSRNSPGQNTGVGRFSLLQGIFPTQGSNPGFLHCRQILYHLSHQGSPRILE